MDHTRLHVTVQGCMFYVNQPETIMQNKAPPQVIEFASKAFKPRFAYGEMAEVNEISGASFSSKLGTGFARFSDAEIPWTVQYDEVILVLEGEITVRTKDSDLKAGPKESIWLPSGTELTYIADSALVFYAIEPADWAEG